MAILRYSFSLALRTLTVPVAYFYFNNLDLSTQTESLPMRQMIMISQFIFLYLFKVILVAGAAGSILSIIKMEEPCFTWQTFLAGVKRYWVWTAALSIIPLAVHAGLFFSGRSLPFEALSRTLTVPILFLFALFLTWPALRSAAGRIKFSLITAVVLAIVLEVFLVVQLNSTRELILSRAWEFLLTAADWFFFILTLRMLIPAQRDERPLIILVNPPFSGVVQSIGSLFLRTGHLAFSVLRAMTPSKYQVVTYNRVLWNDHYYAGNALVGISCLTANSSEAYRIAKGFRERGAKVVMGGPHVSIFPEEALEFCDSVVIGPAESVWAEIIRDYEKGTLQKTYQRPPQPQDIEQLHSYLYQQPAFQMAEFLETRRGCKFQCYFCANPSLQKGLSDLTVKVQEVVRYIQKMAEGGCRSMAFVDTNIYADPAYAKELFRQLIPLNVKWAAAASIDIAADDEAVSLLKQSGCFHLLIGYEITDSSPEEARGGKFSMARRYLELTRKLQKAGISVKGHFIYGFESDSWSSLASVWRFCLKLRPSMSSLTLLTPIPGSAFFDDMVRQNRLIDLNWRSYNLMCLVWDHPRLNKFFFRNCYVSLLFAFLTTTSTFGFAVLIATGVILYLAAVVGV